MALPGNGIVNRGLQVTGGITFATADGFAAVQTMAVDNDTTHAWAATDTAINTSRTAASFAAQAFDATPTRSGQTISMTTTFGTGTANFTIGGISLHNAAAGSVSLVSVTLYGGISQQSIQKTVSFSLAITIKVTFTDNS